jgi:peptide/nickel transport system permease protein
MTGYALRRILNLVPLLLGTTLVLFAVIQAMPGGPEALLISSGRPVAPEVLENYRERLGLDEPVPVQYGKWLWSAARGELGTSFSTGRPVAEVVAERLPATLELMAAAFLLAALTAGLVGTVSAVRPYSWLDVAGTGAAFVGIAMPAFWFALLLQLVFGVWLGWLPVSGRGAGGAGGLVDRLPYLVLPAVVLSLRYTARWSRYLRDSLRSALESDFVRTARAKGLPEIRVVGVHALRNALLPLVTVVALDLSALVGGAVITETVFAWPGVGRLFVTSMLARDYPVLMAILLLGTVAVLVMNLVADLLYGWIDPRISHD